MQTRPKVAIAITDTHVAGTARRIGNLYRALSAQDPSRYHFILNEELYEQLNRADYHLDNFQNVHPLAIRSRIDYKKWEKETISFDDIGRFLTLRNFRDQASKIIKKENICVLQCFLDSIYIFGLLPIRGVVQIASLTSVLRRDYDTKNLVGRLLNFCLRRYCVIDCISQKSHRSVLEWGIPADRVFCAPNSFVDVDRYNPRRKDSNRVVFAGRLQDFKNPETYLDAIAQTHERCPKAEFYLLGMGPLRERLEHRLSILGWPNYIHFGFMRDTSNVLNTSTINVQLQEEDNYPSQTMLEGMAAGNATIATDVGETRRLVNEDTGILIPPSNSQALTEAMIWMLQHPKEASRMGKRGREKVVREQSLRSYLNYIGAVYDQASLLHRFRDKPQR